MITDRQLENLNKLPKEDILVIMHECAEILGMVSIKDYSNIMGMPRRTIYDHITFEKIKTFQISEHKFPLINFKKNI